MPIVNGQNIPLGHGSRNDGKDNPFAGTDYESMWENNPYSDLYYEPSFWDRIGFSNKAKDANAEYERLYNEYIAGIYDQQRQDSYNTPTAEASRMREAGLNPDLLGVPGNGTDAMNKPDAGMNPALNGQSPAAVGLNLITSVLGFATNAYQQISSIKNLGFQNESIESSLFKDIQPQAREFIINAYAKRFSGQEVYDMESLKNEFADTYTTRSARRRARFAFENVLKSSDFTSSSHAYDKLNANDKAMQDYIGSVMKLTSILNRRQIFSDLRYLNHYDSGLAGSSKNSEAMLTQWRNEFYKKMYDDFKNGSDLAGLILIGATDRFSVLGLAGLNSNKKSWLDAGIDWNDSFIGGVGKKLNLW